MLKRFAAGLTAIILLFMTLPAFAYDERLKGYDAKAKAYTYVLYGAFPTAEDGARAPILWRVLEAENGIGYLLSEYILQAHRVDPTPRPYIGWEKSELNLYLNGEFKQNAFTAQEQTALKDNEGIGSVTLPTIDDLRNKAFGFLNNDSREAKSTEYAKANGLYVYQGKQQYSPYWSRTPSEEHAYAHRRVMDDGKTGYICVEVQNLGMRPAIYIDLEKVTISSGAGTISDPYQLTPVYQAEDVASPAAVQAPSASEAPIAAEEPAQAPVFEPASSSPYHPLFPALTAEGYLPAGQTEFVYQDEENGVWLYASDTLRIEINRKADNSKKSRPLRWLEADIFVKDGQDFMKVFYNEQDNPKKEAEIGDIAKKNHLVFAVNADWYYYRVKRNAKKRVMAVGVILRQNEILYDDPAKKAGTSVPNRDILALFPDSDLKVYDFNATTAEALKQEGAYDVLSFGPVLLSEGEVTAQTKSISARQSNNPRMGLGLVEKGHYVAILAEGRIAQSKGCTLTEFAQMFLDKGCVSAYNLDGGGTATMMFMGDYLNQQGSYTADKRLQIEVLGIGQSDAVNP